MWQEPCQNVCPICPSPGSSWLLHLGHGWCQPEWPQELSAKGISLSLALPEDNKLPGLCWIKAKIIVAPSPGCLCLSGCLYLFGCLCLLGCLIDLGAYVYLVACIDLGACVCTLYFYFACVYLGACVDLNASVDLGACCVNVGACVY